ncbi:Transcription initiation factor TFIID subunit 11 [Camellia lanceoleosa]|nr:Transcription initiation factor TFIID subunit 11 [Camellia lanceoleosa]
MKQSKDPFEVAFEEQVDESPPDSPVVDRIETQNQAHSESTASQLGVNVNAHEDEDEDDDYDDEDLVEKANKPLKSRAVASVNRKKKEEDEEEEEENMEVELRKAPSITDPDKMAKMQTILSQFTEEQMSRYESFRRSGFQKANMKRLIASITGSAKFNVQITIAVSGIAKMFVGELVETARIVMSERKESGPIRPCHIREAYRRLKLEGKVPRRSVRRLFR